MTIKNVTDERHAEKWSCMVNAGSQLFRSTSTSVFVKGKINFKVIRRLIFAVLYSLEYKLESHGV